MKLYLSIALITAGTLTSCLEKIKLTKSESTSEVAPEKSSGDVDFDTFIASPGTINIVDFSATWCPPCKQLKPVLHQISQEYSTKVKLKVIDVDQYKQLAGQQGVSGIPDVRFYVNGKQVEKFTGAVPKDQIKGMISEILTKHSKQLNAGANAAPSAVPSAAPDAVAPPHPELAPAPASPPNQSTTPATPSTPAEPTIKPSKGNQLPPGMSKG